MNALKENFLFENGYQTFKTDYTKTMRAKAAVLRSIPGTLLIPDKWRHLFKMLTVQKVEQPVHSACEHTPSLFSTVWFVFTEITSHMQCLYLKHPQQVLSHMVLQHEQGKFVFYLHCSLARSPYHTCRFIGKSTAPIMVMTNHIPDLVFSTITVFFRLFPPEKLCSGTNNISSKIAEALGKERQLETMNHVVENQ